MANKTWDGSTNNDWNTAANWTPSGVPGAADNVRIPAGSPAIDAFDASGTAIGDFIVEAGFANTIGTSIADLQVDPDRLCFAGTGIAFLDIGSANIDVEITNAASAGTGLRGLYLIGSSMNSVSISKGKVGIASKHNTTATVVDLRVSGAADVWIGEGATLTNVDCTGGKVDVRCAVSGTLEVTAGEATTSETGTVATATINGGLAILNSSGTITTLNVNGGTADMSKSGIPRTVTTINVNPGGSYKYDPGVMTLSTISEANAPISVSTSGL